MAGMVGKAERNGLLLQPGLQLDSGRLRKHSDSGAVPHLCQWRSRSSRSQGRNSCLLSQDFQGVSFPAALKILP